MKHGNWLDGEAGPARGSDSFAVPAPTGEPERDRRWPRSGSEDVAQAVDSLARGAERWRALPERERARGLRAVLRQLEADLADASEAAAHLGLAAGELAELSGRWRPALERRASSSAGRSGEIAVLAPDWTDLVAGVGRALVRNAHAGRGVLLLPDPRFPHSGDLWARAWVRRSPVPGALAVLHGAGPALWGEACEHELVTHASLAGCEQRVEAWIGAESDERDGVGDSLELDLRVLRNASACVRRRDDVARRAARLVDAAFGRRTLCGQLPGQVARVFCHERVFSRFTEELLARADRGFEESGTVPFIDRGAWEDLRGAGKLGLDEGATLVFGDSEEPRGERPPVHPLVFTNVEPEMRLLARTRPAPLMCLVRARSDAEAGDLERADRAAEGPPATTGNQP